jgi:DNA-binding transcriptional MerR regulator
MTESTRQPAPAGSASEQASEYTIDELARAAGITVRNLRAYLERGLLPPAGRRRRAAIYTDVHLARLRVISDLLNRGYALANIAELLAAWEKGWDLQQVLRAETVLASPWEQSERFSVSREQLQTWLDVSVRHEDIRALTALELVAAEGDLLHVPHPRILRAIASIVRAGVPLPTLLAHAATLREHIVKVAETLSMAVVEGVIVPHARHGLPPAEEMPRLTEAVRNIRPLAEPLVAAELARALELVATRYLGDRLIAALAPTLVPDAPAKSASARRRKH